MHGHTGGAGVNMNLRFDKAPRRIYWEVTRACDLACRHCRAEAVPERDSDELDTTDGFSLIRKLADFGTPLPHLIFTGGDPLKRTDLFRLITEAQKYGFGVSVAPSATPLLTTDVICQLKAADVEAISLSLDGSNANRHDSLRGIAGCFDRTVIAANTCVEVGLPFQVNTLICEETLGDIPDIYRLATELGASRWSLFFLISVGRGTMLNPISADACNQLFLHLLQINKKGGPVITTTEAPFFRRTIREYTQSRGPMGHGAGIRDGNGIMFISHTGEVHPSGFFPLSAGNIKTDSPIDIYRSSNLFKTLRQPENFTGSCGCCEYSESCGGSRARAFAATGNPMATDPLCFYPPASH